MQIIEVEKLATGWPVGRPPFRSILTVMLHPVVALYTMRMLASKEEYARKQIAKANELFQENDREIRDRDSKIKELTGALATVQQRGVQQAYGPAAKAFDRMMGQMPTGRSFANPIRQKPEPGGVIGTFDPNTGTIHPATSEPNRD